MAEIDSLLLVGSLLILASIGIAKVSENLGVPVLVLFLCIGMLAGSEGPGGIYFDNARLSQAIGIVALVIILFAGGLDIAWGAVRPIFWRGMSLATLGVLLTAIAVAACAVYLLRLPVLPGLLLGAVISSTDAAAVFSTLRAKGVHLRSPLKPLLEFESGSNDPMAVFLTLGLIGLITGETDSWSDLAFLFVRQMGLGMIFGLGLGKAVVYLVNRIRISFEGIYPVFMVASAALIYALTAVVGGSGFLAVYIAGMVIGNSDFVYKRSLLRFFDGLAWLGQIGMFLTLGLLVFPSHLVPVAVPGLIISAFLIFLARPLGVFVSLARSGMSFREMAFISWVGLRGAVPIILATFPLVVGVHGAELLFNLVFFIVVTSALLQGWSIPLVARLLRVSAPAGKPLAPRVEFEKGGDPDMEMTDFVVPFRARIAGKAIVQLRLPQGSLVVLVSRGDGYLVPSGGTVLEEGDAVVVLARKQDLPQIKWVFSQLAGPEREQGGPHAGA